MEFCTAYWWVNLLLFVLGVVTLLKGSDWFVESSSFLARRWGVSEVVIGLTMVSLGTSLPEFATNIYAACTNAADVALGNIIGSNITNILLIMGVGGMAGGILIPAGLARRDGSVMMLATLAIAFPIYLLGALTWWVGILLLAGTAGYVFWLFVSPDVDENEDEEEATSCGCYRNGVVAGLVLGGALLLIFAGSKLMVDNVVDAARRFGVSASIISVTVVAFGTSLPELAVTLGGVIKKRHGIALGNVIGSNIFNILLIMGTTLLIAPVSTNKDMVYWQIPFFVASALILWLFLFGKRFSRWESVILLAGYLLFIGGNIFLMQ